MTLQDQLAKISSEFGPADHSDIVQMIEDIYYYFSQLEDFEVLKVDQFSEDERMVVAACITTMQDPFFKIVVSHIWQRDLAFDQEYSEFEINELGTVFRFLTWDDGYITGEIWFERAKKEGPDGAS